MPFVLVERKPNSTAQRYLMTGPKGMLWFCVRQEQVSATPDLTHLPPSAKQQPAFLHGSGLQKLCWKPGDPHVTKPPGNCTATSYRLKSCKPQRKKETSLEKAVSGFHCPTHLNIEGKFLLHSPICKVGRARQSSTSTVALYACPAPGRTHRMSHPGGEMGLATFTREKKLTSLKNQKLGTCIKNSSFK